MALKRYPVHHRFEGRIDKLCRHYGHHRARQKSCFHPTMAQPKRCRQHQHRQPNFQPKSFFMAVRRLQTCQRVAERMDQALQPNSLFVRMSGWLRGDAQREPWAKAVTGGRCVTNCVPLQTSCQNCLRGCLSANDAYTTMPTNTAPNMPQRVQPSR